MSERDNDDYVGLSDEELAAIRLNDDGSEPEVEETTEEETVDEATEEVVEEVVAEEEPAEEPENATVEEEPGATEVEAANPEPFAPQFEARGVENYKETLANLDADYDARAAELATKYESGDLSFTEYRKEERALSRQYDDIRQSLHEANLKAEIAREHSRQSAEQKWKLEQDIFFTENADYKKDPILRGALSAQLELLYAEEANAGKSGLWFLREAGKVLDAKFNRAQPKPEVNKLKEVEETIAKRKAKHPEIPKTLAAVPAADIEAEDGGNEFAWLDKLSGAAYETAYAKLSERERDKYLAA